MPAVETDDRIASVTARERALTDDEKAWQHRSRMSGGLGGAGTENEHLSYTTRLAITFALVAVMTALIAATILAVVWSGQFENYKHGTMQNMAASMARVLESDYEETGGFSELGFNRAVSISSGMTDLGIELIDADGGVVFDNTEGLDTALVEARDQATGEGQVATADVIVDGETVGTVRIWSVQTQPFLTQVDRQFKTNTYRALTFAAMIAVVLAAILGIIFARNLVNPIKRITDTARQVKEGDLSARTHMTGADEISQLGETFDAMAESIQRDRELERRLTSDVAHELRTPLMGIQATTEAIIDGVFPADDERLASINSETLRLKRLVEALLNLSRLESGSVPFHEETIDLVELMAGLAMNQEALLESLDLRLVFEADENVVVDGDPDMIRQAVANLMSNAVRYNNPGGSVTLGVHKRGDMAAIGVTDTGIGIDEKDKGMVFSRFWRAAEARDRASGGLGVGLSVVKELVDYHNGTIEVESKLGEGTTFTILIPLHEDAGTKGSRGKTGKQKPVKPPREKQQKPKPNRQNGR